MTGAEVLRVALVGLGRHMTQVLAPTLATIPDVEIAAVCELDEQRLDAFGRVFAVPARYTFADELFANALLDAALVAVGHDANAPILRAALQAGVSVFVEKTPVATSAEAEHLAGLQRQTGHYVMAGFNRRFTDAIVRTREAIASPGFGGAHLFQSQFHANRYGERAFLLNHIIHHLDLARFLLGELELTHVERTRVADEEIAYAISFRAESGAIGTIQAASMLDASIPVERLEIIGTGGNVVVDELGFRFNRAPGVSEGRAAHSSWEPTPYRAPQRNLMGYEAELMHFVHSVRTRTAPAPDIADAAKTLRLVEAIGPLLGS